MIAIIIIFLENFSNISSQVHELISLRSAIEWSGRRRLLLEAEAARLEPELEMKNKRWDTLDEDINKLRCSC